MRKSALTIWAIVVFAALGGLCFVLSQFWVVPLAGGAILLGWSWIAPEKETALQLTEGETFGGSGMQLPAIWDEKEVGLGLMRYQKNPGLLSSYVSGIVSRFVIGQDTRTMTTRIAFLEQYNKLAEVARESYKWQRYMNGGRAKAEEDAEDAKAHASLRRAEAELELIELDTDIQRQEKRLQIERLKREIADLNKPAPSPPPPPPRGPSTAEIRAQDLRDLNERENTVIEAMRITRANPTLSEDQKQRKLNGLEDALAQIHEEQARLL
jgi:hypothetical protein